MFENQSKVKKKLRNDQINKAKQQLRTSLNILGLRASRIQAKMRLDNLGKAGWGEVMQGTVRQAGWGVVEQCMSGEVWYGSGKVG